MRVSGIALGIGGGEDGVDENEGTNDLGPQAVALGVAVRHRVGAAAQPLVTRVLEPLDHPGAADRSQALHHHVEDRPRQRQLPRQQQPERHRRVDVPACEKAEGGVEF